MNDSIFRTPLSKELEQLLYDELLNKGRLSIDDLFEIHDRRPEYHLRRVSGGAITLLRERPDVEQTEDEKGHMLFKLIR